MFDILFSSVKSNTGDQVQYLAIPIQFSVHLSRWKYSTRSSGLKCNPILLHSGDTKEEFK
ncbi:hypothetical protein E2C01_039778 [Portunus trituberculatus]|uniref:Uncharacterized protein n=1 Tax=Portunus trituberculatus TaxID=210409 RepID=A0A5B7FLM3_PORTR|nr:hypothetical protein [Portunus trituberculatus]